jgi:hypothetical protein
VLRLAEQQQGPEQAQETKYDQQQKEKADVSPSAAGDLIITVLPAL